MPLGAFKAALMGTAGVSTGDIVLLATTTVSSATGSVEFKGKFTSTYNEYIFAFYNMHPGSNNVSWSFNGSIDNGSNYNVTKTGSFFAAQLDESHNNAALQYQTADDNQQATGYQNLNDGVGSDNDQSCSGVLHLFNPASTTYTKHWASRMTEYHASDYAIQVHTAGYFNDADDNIDAVDFKFESGNIDSGVIKLWGAK